MAPPLLTAIEDFARLQLQPGERVIVQEAAHIAGISLRNKDLVVVTDRRVLYLLEEKAGPRVLQAWSLEDLPPAQFAGKGGAQGYPYLTVAGKQAFLKSWNAKAVAETIETVKNARRAHLQAAAASAPAPAPMVTREVREREVIREVVKVPCRYCQQLNLMNSAKCLSCGAPLG